MQTVDPRLERLYALVDGITERDKELLQILLASYHADPAYVPYYRRRGSELGAKPLEVERCCVGLRLRADGIHARCGRKVRVPYHLRRSTPLCPECERV